MWGKVIAGISAGTTVLGAVAYFPTVVEVYEKGKLFWSIDASKLQDALKSGGIGPEGPRGPQGLPGRPGDQGPSGERGPKGDTGVTPAQLADYDKRIGELQQKIVALEKRLAQVQPRQPASGDSVQVANADNSQPIRPMSIAGFRRHDTGCLYLPPNFQPFAYLMRIGDRFCDNNGENGLSVTKMTDNIVSFTTTYCVLKNTCQLPFSSRAIFSVERIDEDAKSKLNVATVQINPRN